MARMRIVVAVSILAMGVAACRDDAPPLAEQTGYFKSDQRDRVLVYHSPEPLSEAEVRQVLDGVTRTAGRLTRVAFYSGGDNPSPGDQLTLAPDLGRALELTATPPHDDWDWMLIVNPAGEEFLRRRER